MTGTPVATSQDLATFLGVQVDDPRMTSILGYAQTLCETVVSPLPAGADAVVLGVAARAYENPTGSTTQLALGTGHVSYGTPSNSSSFGGLRLLKSDRAALIALTSGRSGAFSVSMLPAGYSMDLPYWDQD